MATSNNATAGRVRFLGGASPRPGLLGVLAFPESLDGTDAEFTRFYMLKQGQWVQQEVQSDIVSVCYLPAGADRGWWLLGKRGDVTSLTAAGRGAEVITSAGTGAGKQGYVKSIRVIGDGLWTAGYRRQVYRRMGNQWTSTADTILASRAEVGIVFNDIDGTSESNVYAVGNRGEIFYFNGKGWTRLDSPTNEHLEGVACIGDEVVIAGREGVVLLGNSSGFESVGPGASGLNFWDVRCFAGSAFMSASAGVYMMSLTGSHELKPAPFPTHVGYKLAVGLDGLFSIGTHQIYAFDGKSVQEVVCPDNV